MVFAVFPKTDPNEWPSAYVPQEFATYKEAQEYKDELEACGVDAIIEEGSGELV